MRLRSVAAAAASCVLVLTLAGCSDGSDDAARSAGASAGAPVPTDAPPAGEKIDTREFATLIADAMGKADTADVSLQVISNGLVTETSGQVDYSGDTPRMKMSMKSPATGTGSMSAIVLDQKMYVAIPIEGVDSKEIYYEIDLRDEDNPLVQQLGGLSGFDPKASIEVFAQGLQAVRLVGNDEIDGVPTQHYLVTTSTEGLRELGAGDGARDGSAGSMPDEVTYDVWLDAEGRLVKMASDLGEGGSMTLTMGNWGGQVDIQAPPAAQVQPYPTGNPTP